MQNGAAHVSAAVRLDAKSLKGSLPVNLEPNSQFVVAGLDGDLARKRAGCPAPAISLRKAKLCLMIEIAGTSPAMTQESDLLCFGNQNASR